VSRRTDRYNALRTNYFTPLEARELSVLPKNTPALKLMRQERIARRTRFEKLAATKLAKGKWTRSQVEKKWLANLSRMYYLKRWRVQYGPKGKQHKLPKGTPNPWAMYRAYEKRTGGTGAKGYVSPWQLKQLRKGKSLLDRGQIFVQKVKRGQAIGKSQIARWVDQLGESIKSARGQRRERLVQQRDNLRGLL
jgi:hypothetical protein